MGAGRWDPSAYASYTTRTAGMSVDDRFKTAHKAKHGLSDTVDPHGVKLRESRDSVDNPESTAIIVGLDVTGSMGMIADQLASNGLGVLFEEILRRKPVSDPHLMFMGIGDVWCDRHPFQVSQFEADTRIIQQLEELHIEHGGGGNDSESYTIPWYFAATRTSIDCFEKRGRKGYLFTIGDECCPSVLSGEQLRKVFGDGQYEDYDDAELLEMVSRSYHVFHIVICQGSFYSSQPDRVRKSWVPLLGQRVLFLDDHTKLAQVIVSAIEVTEGADPAAVASSWSGDTSLVVGRTVGGLPANPAGRDVARL